MSSNMFPLIALAILVVVIVVALLVTRRVRTKVKGPFGTSLDMDASSPGIHATRTTSQESGFRAHDRTGGGVTTDRVTAKQDIDLSSSMAGENSDPKARPPAKDRGRQSKSGT
jgi:hypothetical protein